MRRRLLVLRNLGLGDFLTGIPALRGLRRAFPEHELVLVAPEALRELAMLCGAVDRLVRSPPLGRVDVAVNLHGRGPESHRVVLATRPARLVAFEHPAIAESHGLPRWRADEHEVARWCRLLSESSIPADPADLRLDVRPAGIPGATVVHPGAASGCRRWPAERFAAVARAEREAGRDVLVTGGAAEARLARTVADGAGLPESAVLAGTTSLAGLAGVVAAAGRVVCGDTGVAHLATAVGTPSVVLFGPIPPHRWGPPPDPKHRALWVGLTGDPHAEDVHAGLLAIDVGDVLTELRRLELAA
ncbi:MAG TPA: glycosyltransferase family 9 protein [Gaiellaceae bacterium]|nr:glycosyltransferase family 9 protein [Gaiellaceae bacterium]